MYLSTIKMIRLMSSSINDGYDIILKQLLQIQSVFLISFKDKQSYQTSDADKMFGPHSARVRNET